jgi:phosphoribosylpyrophosphate synthetase
MDRGPFNPNGGLTLIPLPGFEDVACTLKNLIETMGERPKHKATPVDIAFPQFKLYANDETYVVLPNTHILEHDCIVIGSGPGTDQMLMNLLWTLSLLAGRHAGRIAIMTGYVPLGRSDGDEGDSVLTSPPMMMTLANAACGRVGLHRWVCADPHGKQISMAGDPGQLTPIYLTRKLLRFAIEQAQPGRQCDLPMILAFPDDSAAKRYKETIKTIEGEQGMSFQCVTAFKRRETSERTEILGIVGDTDAVRGARVLMFDDEIATGGSVIDMARGLKKSYGAKSVWACATHAVMCRGANMRFLNQIEGSGGQWVNHLVVTDTIPIQGRNQGIEMLQEAGLMSVYSWHEDLAWVIYRHHWNLGIRELR